MNSNDVSLFRQLKDARRQKGITQSSLAEQVGCAQSAICMMERGNGNALAREVILKIAQILDVQVEDDGASPTSTSASADAICPNPDCPANTPYLVGEEAVIMPRIQTLADGAYCVYCGEVLESECHNCKAGVSFGAFCPKCGAVRVMLPSDTPSPKKFVEERQKAIQRFRELF